MRKKAILFVISIVLLLLGLLSYLFLNRTTFISSVLLRMFPIEANAGDGFVIRILRGYGADLLWSVSFTLIIQIIAWVERKRLMWLVLCSLLGVVYELLQFFNLTTGTADLMDVIVYILGSLTAILIIKGGKFYEEKSNPGNCISV